MLFNQWWTQTSDATFLQRVQAKRTRDFPQDFVDPATPPEPSPKTPRSQELPLQGSSSQATTRAAEAAEQRTQDAWTRGGVADPEAFRQRQRDLEREVKQQKKDNTSGLFGATRAVALREQRRQSGTSSLQSSEQTHPAPPTQPPPEPPLKKPKAHPPCSPDQQKPKEAPATKRHHGEQPTPSALPASSASAAITAPSPAVRPPPAPAASSAAAAAAAPPPVVVIPPSHLHVAPALDVALLLGYDATPQAFEDNTFCGLQNLRNTCYANAVLNVLAKLPCCRLWLLQHQQLAQHDAQHPPGCLLCTLAQDIARLTTMPENAPFRPVFVHRRKDWNDGFLFNNTHQQDATEAFLKIFDTCNDIDFLALTRRGIGQYVLQGSREAYTTPLWKTFGTLVHEATHCTRCGKSYASHVYKNIHIIVLPETGHAWHRRSLHRNLDVCRSA